MIVRPRKDYESTAHRLKPAAGSEVVDIDPNCEYTVLFMTFLDGCVYVFIDLLKPFAEGFDLRLFDIIDSSLPAGWRLGHRQMKHSEQYIALLGPDFWVADSHWYERLLDNDEVARTEYAEYLRILTSR